MYEQVLRALRRARTLLLTAFILPSCNNEPGERLSFGSRPSQSSAHLSTVPAITATPTMLYRGITLREGVFRPHGLRPSPRCYCRRFARADIVLFLPSHSVMWKTLRVRCQTSPTPARKGLVKPHSCHRITIAPAVEHTSSSRPTRKNQTRRSVQIVFSRISIITRN